MERAMRVTPGGVLKPAPNDCRVTLNHLKDLGKIHDLLSALNDPYANIGKLVASIPVLAARCVTRAIQRSKLEINSIDHALTLIGNKGLESELLTLLEDLTVLKAETDS
jgi:hypothetical protein